MQRGVGWHVSTCTTLALLAFAGNSLLCRAALRDTGIDAASFTGLRLASGALVLWLLVRVRGGMAGTSGTGDATGTSSTSSASSASSTAGTACTTGTAGTAGTAGSRATAFAAGSWRSALALFAYAAAFSFAYLQLTAATGALLLFGAVQATMISRGLMLGERFSARQLGGFALAVLGLLALLLPGVSAPPISAALLMLGAGIAWGVYSLRGRGAGDATAVTGGNFLRAVPMAAVLSLLMLDQAQLDTAGVLYALASGALTSGLGYALWYAALPQLRASTAATLQLSVPVITALAGVALLAEPISLRLLLAAVAVLGGVWMVVLRRKAVETGRR
jgi:drug/metabolite transporter (DMT)-like permease